MRSRCSAGRFQPSLPARGATKASPKRTGGYGISTLAPREGSDAGGKGAEAYFEAFQPSLPARGATPSEESV